MEDSHICRIRIRLPAMLLCKMNKLKFIVLQIFAVVLYLDILATPQPVIKEGEPQLAIWNFLVQVVIMVALSMLLAPKPKTPDKLKPTGLEQFDIPTAEEGRPIQVLFGKRYVRSPNVVWFGHLKSQAVMS